MDQRITQAAARASAQELSDPRDATRTQRAELPVVEESLPVLRRDGDVFVLDLGAGENRFNPARNEALLGALHEVLASPAPRALVTVASGKIWSNGLDLDWMQAHPDQLTAALDAYHQLVADFLAAGVPTVAAVHGHAFAAGAMFALAHDVIVMREDRGYWCVPEIDLGMAFTTGMTALLSARLPLRTAHTAMTTGRRYGGGDAARCGIVDDAVPEHDVVPTALAHARALASKNGDTLGTIKQRLYAPTLSALRASQTL